MTLQQTFTSVCSPLQSVRVWSASSDQESSGETIITLKDEVSGAVLMEEMVSNQMAPAHDWLEIRFAPVEHAIGRNYIIEITSNVSDSEPGLSFGETARREYINGMVINDNPSGHDLIFQYGCSPLTLARFN